MTEVTPQDFDLDAWIDGAERPARSVTVYQKAGLIAELDALAERIENAEADESAEMVYERGIGEQSESQRLRVEFNKLSKQFHDSALVITLEGRDDAEKTALAKANPGLTGTQMGYVVIADAITAPKITAAQLEKLAGRIGDVQFDRVIAQFHKACTELPAVSADFLPKRSTPDDGGE
ncbi:hypothetical protein AB0N33_00755 [Pseudarthrobacter oxydans]|uniref:biofilm formation regulator BssR n=1 Tax=Pseudarthrobacter oxydans TaxID=1671 RepID=UPI003437E099